MAEELCHSAPVVQDGQNFDGTMRVGFSLHRIEEPSENAKDSEEEDGEDGTTIVGLLLVAYVA